MEDQKFNNEIKNFDEWLRYYYKKHFEWINSNKDKIENKKINEEKTK